MTSIFPPSPVWSQHYQRYINTQQWRSPPRITAVVGLINRSEGNPLFYPKKFKSKQWTFFAKTASRSEQNTIQLWVFIPPDGLSLWPALSSCSGCAPQVCPALPSQHSANVFWSVLIGPRSSRNGWICNILSYLIHCKNVTQSSTLSQRNFHVWLQDSLSSVYTTETDSWDDFI